MSINRTPHTFGAEAATSTLMNAEVKNLWTGLQAGWDSYTVSWTSTGTAPSIGNGFRAGLYMQVGKTLHYRISFQFGSTTSFGTGFYRFSLPFDLNWNDHDPIGTGTVFNASTLDVYGFTAVYDDTNQAARLYGNAGEKVGPTTPFTLNTSDRIVITGYGELS